MKRTDDFIADLDTQLAAAAAGTLRRRRRPPSPRALLMPMVAAATAAAAVFAFVLAAGSGTDPERPAQPPQPPAAGTPFELAPAANGTCAVDPGTQTRPLAEVLEELSVLRRAPGPRGSAPKSDSPLARQARADAPVTVVPMTHVGSCVGNATGEDPAGVCAIVGLGEVRSACFTLETVERRQAAAALADGFLIAVLPDGVQEVTFAIGAERDTYRVTDNVVVANLDAARPGARIQLLTGGSTVPVSGCGEGQVLDTPLPSELKVALPVLAAGGAQDAPDHVMELLTKGGANRIWAAEAHWIPAGDDAGAWLVPVADSRFADCGEPLITAPRAFEGPGACLVGMAASKPRGAVCADLDDFGGLAAPEIPGGRLVIGLAPNRALSLELIDASLATIPGGGAVVGVAPPQNDTPSPLWVGPDGPIRPEQVKHNTVVVLAPTGDQAQAVSDRLAAEGIESPPTASHPPVERTRVMYAAGMAPSARQIAEMLRVQDVLPLDERTRDLADPTADVVVVAGEDLRP